MVASGDVVKPTLAGGLDAKGVDDLNLTSHASATG